jgi:hypothetical protein
MSTVLGSVSNTHSTQNLFLKSTTYTSDFYTEKHKVKNIMRNEVPTVVIIEIKGRLGCDMM